MSVWKQLVLVAVIGFIAIGAWFQLSPIAAPLLESAAVERAGAPGGSGMRGGRGIRSGEGRGMRGGERPATRVVTAEVVEAEAGSRLVAIGTARASRSVTLYAETAGIVSEVALAAGDAVSMGDVLVRLNDAEERLAVEQARLEVEAAEETVTRYERLSQNQAIPAVQLQEARTALARARNELAAAEIALARRSVRAPFDGVMGFAEVDVGDMLSNTTPIANIDDRRTLTIEFNVPERFAGYISNGAPVSATTAAHAGAGFTGEIVAADSRVDPTSRTLKVRAALPNEDDRLRPGMAFSVTLDFDTPGRPAVPMVAVQWDRDGAYLWKVVDGRAVRTPVRVVARTSGSVLVEGDIGPADIVVAEGVEGLREGSQIAEATEEPADAAQL